MVGVSEKMARQCRPGVDVSKQLWKQLWFFMDMEVLQRCRLRAPYQSNSPTRSGHCSDLIRGIRTPVWQVFPIKWPGSVGPGQAYPSKRSLCLERHICVDMEVLQKIWLCSGECSPHLLKLKPHAIHPRLLHQRNWDHYRDTMHLDRAQVS